jgi:hypothetical protein
MVRIEQAGFLPVIVLAIGCTERSIKLGLQTKLSHGMRLTA